MKKRTVSLAFVAAVLIFAIPAKGELIRVYQVHDPIQDDWFILPEVHEIGTINFPPGQLIESGSVPWRGHIPCPSEYRGGGAAQVWIRNLTGVDWRSVYYVADYPQTSLSNWDEWVGQVGFVPPWFAFKIDNTGLNKPLVYESMLPDGIFQAGEIWEFVIQEYANTLGAPAHAFESVGLIAGASAGWPPSSGSIIVVPEPSTMALSVIGALGAGLMFVVRRCRASRT